MSEYNHEMFSCDMPANTPEFNEGYKGIKWKTPKDKDGNPIKNNGGPKKQSKKDEKNLFPWLKI